MTALAQASVEVPHLAHDRRTVGSQLMYQDFLQVEYFGLGNDSRASAQNGYRFKNTDFVGYATVQATRWLSVGGRFGDILRPRLSAAAGPRVLGPGTVDLFSDAVEGAQFMPRSSGPIPGRRSRAALGRQPYAVDLV
jgi:hypothetical protein